MGLDTSLGVSQGLTQVSPAAVRALLSEPWAISDTGRQQVIAAAMYALQGRDAIGLRGTRRASNRDGVAVVPVYGALFTRDAWWGSDYETILKDFNAALDDREVKAIAFDFDSPGGLVTGAHDMAAAIFAARGRKPIIAFVGGGCMSAAYWIASACDRIVASPTAMVGNIGCFASLVDDSEMMAKLGLKVYEIPNDQSPFKILDPANPADRDRARALVTQQASVFIADVAKHRGVNEDRVEAKFGKGDPVVGAAALAAGMVDALGDFESLVVELSKSKTKSSASAVAAKSPLRVVAVQKKNTSTGVRASRVAKKGDPMADLEKLKEHAKALHDAAHEDGADADSACKAMVPHMKALHSEMGDDSPFKKDDDGDEDDGAEAKAFMRELGGVKAARGAFSAMQKTATIVEELRKENAKAKADKESTEVKAMLDEAMTDGRLNGAADRAGIEKDYQAHGVDFVRACLARLPKKAVAAREPSSTATTVPVAMQTAQAVASLTPAELSLAQRRGIKPEDFGAFKAQYMGALKKGVAVQDKE